MNEKEIKYAVRAAARKRQKYKKGLKSIKNIPDAFSFAEELGNDLSSLLEGVLDDQNRDSLIKAGMQEAHKISSDAAYEAQLKEYEKSGVNLKPLKATANKDRVRGALIKLNNIAERKEQINFLRQVAPNYTMSAVDDFVKKNYEAVGGTRGAKLIRIANAGACKYCKSLAGTYNYPNEPVGVFSRHRDCRCIMRFVPFHKGYVQDVWSKKMIDTHTEPELPKGALHIDEVPKVVRNTLRQSPSGVVLKGVKAHFKTEANRLKRYGKMWQSASMYDILNNSKYKGKKFNVVQSGKKVYFHLDENRTLVYSPSGTYFRIQDRQVHKFLISKYLKIYNSEKAIQLANKRKYVTLEGEDYESIYNKLRKNHKDLSQSDLDNLVTDIYQKMTHFKDKR